MKHIFEYLGKNVEIYCYDGEKFKGKVIGNQSYLEEDYCDDSYDMITVYDGKTATDLFREEIKYISEID